MREVTEASLPLLGETPLIILESDQRDTLNENNEAPYQGHRRGLEPHFRGQNAYSKRQCRKSSFPVHNALNEKREAPDQGRRRCLEPLFIGSEM